MSDSIKNNLSNPLQKELFQDIKRLIEKGQQQAVSAVNSALTLTYWYVGQRINQEILQGERAKYGKQVVASLSKELVILYGRSFEVRNLRRMMQFAELFHNIEIVTPLVSQLSWTHFTILITLPSNEAREYYTKQAIEGKWSKRELQRQIERKAFERSAIADTKQKLTKTDHLIGNFKDPYFLDFLGLKKGYLENELENTLLKELELFIMELGKGFTFVERQKRYEYYRDLLLTFPNTEIEV